MENNKDKKSLDTTSISTNGYGMELVIGTLTQEQVSKILEIDEEELSREYIEEILGLDWPDCDDIWHYHGVVTDDLEFLNESKKLKPFMWEPNDSIEINIPISGAGNPPDIYQLEKNQNIYL